MLPLMRDSGDTGRIPPVQPATGPPIGASGRAPFENPSLDHYTDLRFARHPRRRHRRWVVWLFALVALIPIVLLLTMSAIYWQARRDEARPVDAIVVMGAAQYNGRPSEVLAARLDHTLQLYQDGYAPVIIVTGGKQPGDVYTEAGTSEQYLINRGVPPEAILMEDTGNDTWASLRNVATVAGRHDIHRVLLVSDGFHLFRTERMARAVGFEAYTSPATGSPIRPWSGDEFSYVIRETGAVIVQAPDWLF